MAARQLGTWLTSAPGGAWGAAALTPMASARKWERNSAVPRPNTSSPCTIHGVTGYVVTTAMVTMRCLSMGCRSSLVEALASRGSMYLGTVAPMRRFLLLRPNRSHLLPHGDPRPLPQLARCPMSRWRYRWMTTEVRQHGTSSTNAMGTWSGAAAPTIPMTW